MEMAVTALDSVWGWVLPGFLEAAMLGRWVPGLRNE